MKDHQVITLFGLSFFNDKIIYFAKKKNIFKPII